MVNNLDKEKFDIVIVLGSKRQNDYRDLIGQDIYIYYLNSSKLRYSLFKLVKAINKHKPDLLFSTIYQNNIMLLIAKLLSFKRTPTVIRESSNRIASGSVTLINRLVIFILYNCFANKIIALSKGVEEVLAKDFRVKKSKIELIYNPIEVESIKRLSDEKVTDLNKIDDNEKLVIAVGRLVEAKDYITLLKAFKIVTENIHSRLIILGKSPLENKLKSFSENLGMKEKVVFMGFKKNPYKYMKKADVFVLSSKWEGFGHVIVEAMAAGTPVISTDCNSGPREIIKDNEYGVLVPVGDIKKLSNKIIDFIGNQELMDYYSFKGSKRAQDFYASRIVKQYEKMIEEYG
ncbi:glycosyltransferase [Virgibacillus kimchii]